MEESKPWDPESLTVSRRSNNLEAWQEKKKIATNIISNSNNKKAPSWPPKLTQLNKQGQVKVKIRREIIKIGIVWQHVTLVRSITIIVKKWAILPGSVQS